MSVVWIGDDLREKVRKFVLKEIGISSRKLESELIRKAVVFVIDIEPEQFQKAWKEGTLDT